MPSRRAKTRYMFGSAKNSKHQAKKPDMPPSKIAVKYKRKYEAS